MPQIRPILASLRRHKLTVGLLVLQVAFTCAIVTNAVSMVAQHVGHLTVRSGLDEDTISLVTVDDLNAGSNPLSLHQADLAALRRLPGVEATAMVNHLPLGPGGTSGTVCRSLRATHALLRGSVLVPGCAAVAQYGGGPGMASALGLKLVAGRDFRDDEYVASQPGPFGATAEKTVLPAVIISEALARRLYPGHPSGAVGQVVYYGVGLARGEGSRVVGVIAHLHGVAANNNAAPGKMSLLAPIRQAGDRVTFVLRSTPDNRDRVLRAAVAALVRHWPGRQIPAPDVQTYSQMRAAYLNRNDAMIYVLIAATLSLLFVTALGIAGLESFWVGQRTRTVGIRRALGATRSDILRYFQTENFLIVTSGVVLGALFAVVLNALLTGFYGVQPLGAWYLPAGAIALWVLGQLAVLGPAFRAARVLPMAAARSR
ncbi:MAG TPA: FtsX-like permease family protein [Rhodanobacteraceae bacterium]